MITIILLIMLLFYSLGILTGYLSLLRQRISLLIISIGIAIVITAIMEGKPW